MVLRTLLIYVALAGAFAERLQHALVHHLDGNTSSSANLCSSWLLIDYSDGTKVEGSTFGSFRYLENAWTSVELFKKTDKSGCVKSYIAECADGNLKVVKTCPGKPQSSESRCLGGFGCLGSAGGRKSRIAGGESIELYRPAKNGSSTVNLAKGTVVVWIVDPAKGIDLEDAPGNYNWKTEWGCYCCKHSYGALNNPFSRSSGRAAWRKGSDGNMECMLAWRMIGNGMDHDNPADTSFLGVMAMIPEFILTAADILTLTIGRHLACTSTCPFRKAEYEQNQYPFTKIQTDQDKY